MNTEALINIRRQLGLISDILASIDLTMKLNSGLIDKKTYLEALESQSETRRQLMDQMDAEDSN